MKTTEQGVQSTDTALGTLPAGAKIQTAKGHRTSNGHRMEFSYTVGSSSFHTAIVTTGGQRA